MSTTATSDAPASDDSLLRNTFHVVPPPPPRKRPWSELAIAIGLALLINLIAILSLIFKPPVSTPPAEPPSISVDLVPEPEPQPQPQPQPEPQPEPEPEPEPQPSEEESSGFFTRSGVGNEAQDAGSGGEKNEDMNLRPDPVPEDKTSRQRENTAPDENLPGWAMDVGEGYGIPKGDPRASGRDRTATSGSGGDAYMNSARNCIADKFIFPREAAGQSGVAVLSIDVHRSGRVLRVGFIKSAGVPALDRAAVEVIARCAPFPPFPSGAPQEVEPFALTLPMPIPSR
ncbi:energy transducer TonB family protein [Parvibaculum sp.]|uniref:energy transducer TonB family protein n=1 Tax=Parvibaculum sp. TaxID=2024848 RepID=UPI003BA98B7A